MSLTVRLLIGCAGTVAAWGVATLWPIPESDRAADALGIGVLVLNVSGWIVAVLNP